MLVATSKEVPWAAGRIGTLGKVRLEKIREEEKKRREEERRDAGEKKIRCYLGKMRGRKEEKVAGRKKKRKWQEEKSRGLGR
jgi:hypothetical protein